MKKFLAVYYAPAEAMAQSANATEEQKAEGMKPWFAWKDKVGDGMVDFGAPLMPGAAIDPSGNWSTSSKEVAGYSVVRASDAAAAKALFDGHPHLSWHPGASVEVHEFAPM